MSHAYCSTQFTSTLWQDLMFATTPRSHYSNVHLAQGGLRDHTIMESITFTLQVIRLKERILALMGMEFTGSHVSLFTVWDYLIPQNKVIDCFLQTRTHFLQFGGCAP